MSRDIASKVDLVRVRREKGAGHEYKHQRLSSGT